jgi:hypothetical protein
MNEAAAMAHSVFRTHSAGRLISIILLFRVKRVKFPIKVVYPRTLLRAGIFLRRHLCERLVWLEKLKMNTFSVLLKHTQKKSTTFALAFTFTPQLATVLIL